MFGLEALVGVLSRVLGLPQTVPPAIKPAEELDSAAERIAARYQKVKPDIDAMAPVLKEHMPAVIAQVQAAWPDIEIAIDRFEKVAPAFHDLADWIQRLEGGGMTTQQAVTHVRTALAYRGGPKG